MRVGNTHLRLQPRALLVAPVLPIPKATRDQHELNKKHHTHGSERGEHHEA